MVLMDGWIDGFGHCPGVTVGMRVSHASFSHATTSANIGQNCGICDERASPTSCRSAQQPELDGSTGLCPRGEPATSIYPLLGCSRTCAVLTPPPQDREAEPRFIGSGGSTRGGMSGGMTGSGGGAGFNQGFGAGGPGRQVYVANVGQISLGVESLRERIPMLTNAP